MKIQTYVELSVEADVDYSPSRPAPACQNHDSPKFSDPGDDEFMEIGDMAFIIITDDGKKIKIPVPDALADYVAREIDGDVIDQCRDQWGGYESDMLEYKEDR